MHLSLPAPLQIWIFFLTPLKTPVAAVYYVTFSCAYNLSSCALCINRRAITRPTTVTDFRRFGRIAGLASFLQPFLSLRQHFLFAGFLPPV